MTVFDLAPRALAVARDASAGRGAAAAGRTCGAARGVVETKPDLTPVTRGGTGRQRKKIVGVNWVGPCGRSRITRYPREEGGLRGPGRRWNLFDPIDPRERRGFLRRGGA